MNFERQITLHRQGERFVRKKCLCLVKTFGFRVKTNCLPTVLVTALFAFCLQGSCYPQSHGNNETSRAEASASYDRYSEYSNRVNGPKYEYRSSEFSDEPATERYRNERSVWLPKYEQGGDYRQPSSMVQIAEDQFLIATRKSGELFLFDARNRESRSVFKSSEASQYGEICQIDHQTLAITDDKYEQVCIYRMDAVVSDSTQVQLVARLPCEGKCGDLCFDALSRQLYATGIWSRRLYCWKMAEDGVFGQRKTLDLSINGGQLLLFELNDPQDKHLLVADAFGSVVELVDTGRWLIRKRHRLFDHNFQSLRMSPDGRSALMPCQNLSDFIPAVRGEITWGGMLSNNVRGIPFENFLQDSVDDIYTRSEFIAVGFAGNGGGTPTDVAVASNGTLAVSLGGSNQLAIRRPGQQDFEFFDTGIHPTHVAFANDEQTVVAVCEYSDSITTVDLLDQFSVQHTMLGAIREPTLVELGQQKFHDSRLSHDGWMSCASCHVDGHTSGLLNDNLTDHSQGTPKRILSLLGSRDSAPYSWFGEHGMLKDQVFHSIQSTMASDHPVSQSDVQSIVAFISTLEHPPSVSAARGETLEGTAAGRKLFRALGCADCHAGRELTSVDSYDVGLVDQEGKRLFNPPSLRGVSQREDGLFHDASVKSLEELFQQHSHQLDSPLKESQLHELVAYLRTL